MSDRLSAADLVVISAMTWDDAYASAQFWKGRQWDAQRWIDALNERMTELAVSGQGQAGGVS